jgi:hypothetical protein
MLAAVDTPVRGTSLLAATMQQHNLAPCNSTTCHPPATADSATTHAPALPCPRPWVPGDKVDVVLPMTYWVKELPETRADLKRLKVWRACV